MSLTIPQPEQRSSLRSIAAKLFGHHGASLIGDGAWSVTAKIFSHFAQLAGFIVAAHVLTPAQFGFFAFASAIAVILVVLAEGGWREFVLKAYNCEDKLNRIATMSAVSSSLFTAIALAIAFYLDQYADFRWEGLLVAVFSLWIAPAALSSIYEGILVSGGRLRVQSRLTIAAEAVGLAVTVAGLWLGWEVFALVAGKLVMQFTHLGGAIAATRWIPRPAFERSFAHELLEFSRHILLTRVTIRIRGYAGTLMLGSFMGLAEAGIFRAAERIVLSIGEVVGEPARMLAWTIFRKAKAREENGEHGALARVATAYIAILLTLAAPLFIGVSLIAEPLVRIALGEQWLAASDLIAALCVAQLFLVSSFVTEPLLSVSGTIRKLPPVSIFNAAIFVGAMVIFAPFGAGAAAAGQIAAAIVAFGSTLYLQVRYGAMNWSQVIRNLAGVAFAAAALGGVAAALGALASSYAMGPAQAIALQALGGTAAYFAFLALATRLGASNPFQLVLKDHDAGTAAHT
jgi:O-antigen/teichoic acid export membrane protein